MAMQSSLEVYLLRILCAVLVISIIVLSMFASMMTMRDTEQKIDIVALTQSIDDCYMMRQN